MYVISLKWIQGSKAEQIVGVDQRRKSVKLEMSFCEAKRKKQNRYKIEKKY